RPAGRRTTGQESRSDLATPSLAWRHDHHRRDRRHRVGHRRRPHRGVLPRTRAAGARGVRPGAPGSGFRGLTVSLVLDQPSSVDATVAAALAAGGTEVKPVSRSLWGYGGTVAAPDGTVVTVASAQKKDTGPATSEIQQLV